MKISHEWIVAVVLLLGLSVSAAEVAPPPNLAPLVRVLQGANDAAVERDVLVGMHEALRDRRSVAMPPGWHEVYQKLHASDDPTVREEVTLLSLLFGDSDARRAVHQVVADTRADAARRSNGLASLVQTHDPTLVPLLYELLGDSAMRGEALRALAAYADDHTASQILSHYEQYSDAEKRDAAVTLCSRRASAAALLDAIDAGKVPKHDLVAFNVRQILSLSDPSLEAKLAKVWGPIHLASPDKAAELARYKAKFNPEVMSHANPANGRVVFNRTCAQCHTLFDTGGQVGPNLTGAQRQNLDYVLGKVLDPSAVVSKDYRMTTIRTKDGRVINGIVAQETPSAVTLKAPNEMIVVPVDEIDKRKLSDTSMMPEGMLASMSQDDARDLLAYLASPAQVALPNQSPAARAH